jgi:hypothetical protein
VCCVVPCLTADRALQSAPGTRRFCPRHYVAVPWVVASFLAIGVGLAAIVARRRMERSPGFGCAMRVSEGSVARLRRRWRYGYWSTTNGHDCWRLWPTYRKVDVPIHAVAWGSPPRPLRRGEWLAINRNCVIVPVTYEGGARGEMALLPKRLEAARSHLPSERWRAPLSGPPAASVGAGRRGSYGLTASSLAFERFDDSNRRVQQVPGSDACLIRALWADRRDRQRHASMSIRCDPDARAQVAGPVAVGVVAACVGLCVKTAVVCRPLNHSFHEPLRPTEVTGEPHNCRSALAERRAIGQSVSMATGIASYLWSLTQLAELLD